MTTIWHNPRCSKSRQTLALLEEKGIALDVRLYLNDAPDADDLRAAVAAMGAPQVIDMMRTGEKRFKELGLSKDSDDDTLIHAMTENPILIERPVVFHAGRAKIGRPPEAVLDLF